MPQNNALLQQAVFVKTGGAGLVDHLPHRPAAYLEIIRSSGVAGRKLRRNIFHVRQPYVHHTVQKLYGFQRFISAGIIHDGQGQALCPRLRKSLQNPGQPLGGGDQIDVVSAFLLKLQKDLGQTGCIDRFAQPFLTDFIVLAIAAFQAASGEEYGAAALCAADARLFPVMQRCAGHHQLVGRTAYPGAPGAVRFAAAGAESAGCGNLQDKTSQNRRTFQRACIK